MANLNYKMVQDMTIWKNFEEKMKVRLNQIV